MADRGDAASHGAAIILKGVWKIFGARAPVAMMAILRDRLDKDEVARRFGCVVGVANVNISVRPGEIFCVMGLSGSGKSTLIRHINRLLEPSAGEIFVDGENVMAKSPAELRALRSRRIAMVFQSFGLLPHRTVRDNVALPLEIQAATKQRRFDAAEAALAKVNLSGWGDRYCHELSGGMQQRVGLARALAADPAILLMDEPFSALDPLIRRQLQDEFLALSRSMGKTVIFITHDLDEAIRIGDRIAIMKDGVIVQTDTPEEIVTSPKHDYVAKFVADISRLKVITAGRIMESVESFKSRSHPELDVERLRRVDSRESLAELVELAARDAAPLAVTDPGGSVVGIVDRQILLDGLRKGEIRERP
ncbi:MULTISPECIES: betaine/proline/choline family ABC transporter ATP-binding protein [unclassified Mesorhizobium]|uniref:quaternary amine ABC transporter ATP-binding protein n=1 Tax=unclassified Mesorhizobium TaxID=325217 RepID=UPI001D006792|nr:MULTISPECIES: betaine/proline/choline family ABC transporter ATP-binding protein [unclassified Mesorhizobium]UCI16013.1 betaine/proline/choline family ABC transporter ATP-binding protein [Mesorhizobium sp. B2-1-1]